jgi:hypothetical protein
MSLYLPAVRSIYKTDASISSSCAQNIQDRRLYFFQLCAEYTRLAPLFLPAVRIIYKTDSSISSSCAQNIQDRHIYFFKLCAEYTRLTPYFFQLCAEYTTLTSPFLPAVRSIYKADASISSSYAQNIQDWLLYLLQLCAEYTNLTPVFFPAVWSRLCSRLLPVVSRAAQGFVHIIYSSNVACSLPPTTWATNMVYWITTGLILICSRHPADG